MLPAHQDVKRTRKRPRLMHKHVIVVCLSFWTFQLRLLDVSCLHSLRSCLLVPKRNNPRGESCKSVHLVALGSSESMFVATLLSRYPTWRPFPRASTPKTESAIVGPVLRGS
ncbi:hypothetical protein K402DRAFT_159335 [Aulographum hederae CBS 113979]|uniref:Uncharacterized protein n=1 Tax=Aulographum hederae CBS 113979 TaxID=1176131 RepID=A0A6G1GS98_9PEZI|nr:hypothetical protein K402DRAFT_159335 [Aulographum hederae CBS 113979]